MKAGELKYWNSVDSLRVKIRGSGTGAACGLSLGEGRWTEVLKQHFENFGSWNRLGMGRRSSARGQVCFDSAEGIASGGSAGQLGISVGRNHGMSQGRLWVVHRVNAGVQ